MWCNPNRGYRQSRRMVKEKVVGIEDGDNCDPFDELIAQTLSTGSDLVSKDCLLKQSAKGENHVSRYSTSNNARALSQ